jgi:hypothetical protein
LLRTYHVRSLSLLIRIRKASEKLSILLFVVPAVFTREKIVLLYRQVIHVCFIVIILVILDTIFTRFEVRTTVFLKMRVFWHVTHCHWVSSYRRFEERSAFISRVQQSSCTA